MKKSIWDNGWVKLMAVLAALAIVSGFSLGLLYLTIRVVRLAWGG